MGTVCAREERGQCSLTGRVGDTRAAVVESPKIRWRLEKAPWLAFKASEGPVGDVVKVVGGPFGNGPVAILPPRDNSEWSSEWSFVSGTRGSRSVAGI